jgi:hypothetical protein
MALVELTEKIGWRATPVITIGQEVVVGFDRGKLHRVLGLLGDYEETTPPT